MSNGDVAVPDESKCSLPLSTVDLIVSVIDSIRAKGGHCSRDILKTSVGKSEGAFNWAISSAMELRLVESKGKDYSLSLLGNDFASSNEEERKKILREIILSYPPYHTLLIRLKNAPENQLSKSDITKAWYDLNKSGTDRTR